MAGFPFLRLVLARLPSSAPGFCHTEISLPSVFPEVSRTEQNIPKQTPNSPKQPSTWKGEFETTLSKTLLDNLTG